MQDPKEFQFPKEGVLVRIPKDLDLTAEGEPFDLKTIEGATGDFKPRREVIDLSIYGPGYPMTEWNRFPDPIELRIGFTQEDLDSACEKNDILQIAYWKNGKWNPLKYSRGAPSFPAQGFIGDLVVSLDEWGDPPISAGP